MKDAIDLNDGGPVGTPSEQLQRRSMSKTPNFTAMNAARYQRQELIKAIDLNEGTHLICYVGGLGAEIDRSDIIYFVDMLHNIPDNSRVDLLLQTCGGDVDACEKLVSFIHAKTRECEFRVIVPDLAKSAGTLMALGGNKIIMSESSELGMIDPQFPMKDSRGNEFMISVTAYLEAYEQHSEALRKSPGDPIALLMLDGFDAKVVKKFEGIRDRVRRFAEDMLKRQGAPASTISAELMSTTRWKTHGQPIGHADAKQLGLPVEFLPALDARWSQYWSLYCLQRIAVGEAGKIFESSYVSQVV